MDGNAMGLRCSTKCLNEDERGGGGKRVERDDFEEMGILVCGNDIVGSLVL